ncbi:Receptor-like protein 12 [Morella rubra]|uniref:Receptor-like protein 12 n=1 Tax=Morella rubra TaxID=262757 RepID=A0A6A1WFD3_9ROSI|nr:Receptor-like protein 12 [Morella rubra]
MLADGEEALLSFKQSLLDPSGRLSFGLAKIAVNGLVLAATTGQDKSSCSTSKTHFQWRNLMTKMNLITNMNGEKLSTSRPWGSLTRWSGTFNPLAQIGSIWNNIHGKIPSSFANLCNLQTFSLYFNRISGEINEFVDGLSRCSNSVLESLDLSNNRLLGGKLPYSIGALQKLQSIDLSYCSFRGSIPDTIGNLSFLQQLSLSRNQMSGTIPKSIGKLSMLVEMSLGENFWEGVLTGAHFQYLTRLKYLYLSRSENSTFVLDVQHDWVPPFKLVELQIDKMPIGPSFPAWLQTQNGLQSLSLEDVVISEPIPENIEKLWPNLAYLNLASNSIIGEIPRSVGLLKNLSMLSLRNNCLSGELLAPRWEDLKSLYFLDVANNNISGNLPSSMGYLTSLVYLSLNKNHLEGQLPSWFRNYTKLATLDLGGNNFSGNLPAWIGRSLSSLLRLNLRSNWFVGDLPQDLCLLSELKILDLAQNNLSGVIPHCLGNLSKNNYDRFFSSEEMELVWKGREYLYEDSNIHVVYSLDLSNNNLSGEIPEDITTISSLVNLNLSMNHLTGKIPKGIGNLYHLESLDLSRNILSGFLPQELSNLTFLSHLNLSFNNFSGKIPSGNQLQTLNDPSMYEGNSLLCGPPLSTKCPWEGDDPQTMPTDRVGRRKKDWRKKLRRYHSTSAWYWALLLDFGEFAVHSLLRDHGGKLIIKDLIILKGGWFSS